MYRVKYTKRAAKALQKMDRHTAMLIYAWIGKNLEGCTNPYQHGKSLTADRSGQWRYRVGDYRLICEISEQTITILVLNVGHRKAVYKL